MSIENSLSQLPDEVADAAAVVDESSNDETIAPTRYEITSFGADYDVAGLVKRMRKGDIYVPSFQRDYVWKLPEASRFVESLLLGLPVPGVFLAREPQTNKLLVIDGQQRLKTLHFFYDGAFNPRATDQTQRVFKLTRVSSRFEGLTYATLPERDRIQLDDYILHATVIKQESPDDDDTSIYHVFERLNTGGQRLVPQEIRVAVYHGPLIELVESLNEEPNWRRIYGKPSPRLKDSELILRFLGLYFEGTKYQRPLSEFLNKFAAKHRTADMVFLNRCRSKFSETVAIADKMLGSSVFKPERSLNAAVYDSVMVGLALRLDRGPIKSESDLKRAYAALLADSTYKEAVSKSTADEGYVALRLRRATEAFSSVA